MKKILLASALMCLSVAAFADIADQVVVVRPTISTDASDVYNNLALWMESLDNMNLASYFRAKADGGFGSGVVVRGQDNAVYVLTNYHVVAQSDSVKIELKGRKSEGELLEECRVLTADPYRDLAIILVPGLDASELTFLEFSQTTPKDGVAVVSAGYPGLDGEPSWQFGSGTVTNQEAIVNDLDVPKIDYVIQHSAIIDPGSSGGPLLVQKGGTDEFEIVGINTWSVNNRDNTYFAIPAQEVLEYLEETEERAGNTNASDAQLDELCTVYSNVLQGKEDESGELRNASRILSTSIISRVGFDAMIDHLESSDGDDALDERMFLNHTFDYLGTAILQKKFGLAGDTELRYSTTMTNTGAVVIFQYGEKEEPLTLKMENGRWVIVAFGRTDNELVSSDSPNAALFRTIEVDEEYKDQMAPATADSIYYEDSIALRDRVRKNLIGFSISAWGGLCLGSYENNDENLYIDVKGPLLKGGIGITYTPIPFLGIHLGAEFQKMTSLFYSYGTTPSISEELDLYRFIFPILLRVNLPIIKKSGGIFQIYFSTGLQVAFNTGDEYHATNGLIRTKTSLSMPLRFGMEMTPVNLNDLMVFFVELGADAIGGELYHIEVNDNVDGWIPIQGTYAEIPQLRLGVRFLL